MAAGRAGEERRLAALRRTAVLDTPPEQLFDDITGLAAQVCDVPIALMTLVDEHRQWFKSQHGLQLSELPRDAAFCHRTIQGEGVLVVEDARSDPRFADSPLVTGESAVRFYAGAPVVVEDGQRIGTVCVLDREPRTLDERQIATLQALARHASRLLSLRSSERQLQRFLELAPESVAIVGVDGTIIYANASLARLAGVSDAAELRHRSLHRLVGTTGDCLTLANERGPGGTPVRLDTELEDAAGRRIPVELSCGLVHIGAEPLIKVIVSDLRDRLAQQRELERSRNLLRGIIDHSPTLILVKDLDGRYLLVNEPYAQTIGRPAEEIVGRHDRELFDPYRADFLAAADRRALTEGPFSFRDTSPDGRSFLTATFPLLDQAGEPFAVGAISADLTDQLRLEEQSRRLQQRLEQRQRLEGLGSLAGGIAHDFNNLLAVVLSAADLARENLEGVDDERLATVARDLRDIRDAAERAVRLTRQLLVFARRQPAAPGVLDLNVLVRDMADLLRRSAGPTVDLVLDLDPEPCVVEADTIQLEQVLLNLTVNGRDAMPAGGRLTIRTRRTELDGEEVAEVPAGPAVLLEVADTGTGMDEATAARAFEPFFSTKPPGQGTGLGLATVYGAVTHARGAVQLDTAPGRGTTVRIHLPAAPIGDLPRAAGAEPDPVETGGAATAPVATGGGAVVLLVEDQEVIRQIVGRMLHRNGYEVLEAADAEEAMDRFDAAEGRVDLLLSDVVLGGRSGVELAALLRVRRPDLPVLLVSGYPQLPEGEGDAGRPLPLLQKPFTEAELTARIAAVLPDPPQPAPPPSSPPER